LAGGGSERSCKITGGGGNGGSVGGGAHVREEKGMDFYIRVCAEAYLLHSEATDALRRGVRQPSACVRGGRTDGAVASARTPRGAWAHQPRRVLEVRAGLTHAVVTRGLLGGALVRQRTAAARRWRVDPRAMSRWRVPALGPWHVPCSFARFSKNCK
jgi:hypothetical protein